NPGVQPTMRVDIDVAVPFKLAKQRMVEEFERRFLKLLLDEHGGNVSKAARATGLDRMTIHKMMSRRGLSNPRSRGS
ncbi:MAG: helix-turn-helix domain-containing protein, partial [Myxococcota bacterium]